MFHAPLLISQQGPSRTYKEGKTPPQRRRRQHGRINTAAGGKHEHPRTSETTPGKIPVNN
jgi:hypothetical protein